MTITLSETCAYITILSLRDVKPMCSYKQTDSIIPYLCDVCFDTICGNLTILCGVQKEMSSRKRKMLRLFLPPQPTAGRAEGVRRNTASDASSASDVRVLWSCLGQSAARVGLITGYLNVAHQTVMANCKFPQQLRI